VTQMGRDVLNARRVLARGAAAPAD
jgi:ribosomal protein L34